MPSATAKRGLPFPVNSDPPNVAGDFAALAQAADEKIVPPGTLLATARATAPAGYLLCDGAAVSRATYADLFAAIGTAYGAGDGSTTFTLPDLRGRVPVGVDGAAARLTANDALGQTGGEEKHTLTVAELAAHDHDPDAASSGRSAFSFTGVGVTTLATTLAGSGPHNVPYGFASPGAAVDTGMTGSSTPHNTMQPYQIVNWIIAI